MSKKMPAGDLPGLFVENLVLIDEESQATARRLGLSSEEVSDFVAWIRLKVVERNYDVLQGCACSSDISKVLKPRIEFLTREYSYAGANLLRPSQGIQLSLEILNSGRFSNRCLLAEIMRRTALDEQHATREGNSLQHVKRALQDAMDALPKNDRALLELVFAGGKTLSGVARLVDLPQKVLYRRLDKILNDLRRNMESRGINKAEVSGVLSDGFVSGQVELNWDAFNLVSGHRPLFQEAKSPASLVEVCKVISAALIAQLKRTPEDLYSLHPRIFEELVAEILAGFGWRVELSKATRDGGYDILGISTDISGLRTSWLIECKRYNRSRKVGVDVIRSLYGARDTLVPGGMLLVATTSYFSRDVHALKESRYDLDLVDYERLEKWLEQYQSSQRGDLYSHRVVDGLV